MRKLSFRREARNDLAEVRKWYLQEAPHVVDDFADRIDESLDSIARAPTQFAINYQDVRVCLVNRFFYVVYFRDLGNRLQILAVLNARGDPCARRSRL